MEVNQKRSEAAVACFDFNKNLDKVHVTSDLKCFLQQGDAVAHARTLVDKSIDVFERDGDDAEFDSIESDELTDEAENIPDHLTAAALRQSGAAGATFDKAAKPEQKEPVTTETPVLNISGSDQQNQKAPNLPSLAGGAGANVAVSEADYLLAKSQFTELYQQWNGLSADEKEAEGGKALSDQLSGLHETITQYEALNPSTVTTQPAAGAAASGAEPTGQKGIVGVLNHVVETVEHALGADQNPDQQTQQQ